MSGRAWCILRTSGRSTLGLANTLAEDGFTAWTPFQIVKRRAPRRQAVQELPVPILPSFVFVWTEQDPADPKDPGRIPELQRLAQESKSDISRHVGFSVFRHRGSVPTIADRELNELRKAERRAVPKEKRRVFKPGETVRVPDGPFAGMSGLVEEADGRFVLVGFGGNMRVKIASFILDSDSVCDGQAQMGIAA